MHSLRRFAQLRAHRANVRQPAGDIAFDRPLRRGVPGHLSETVDRRGQDEAAQVVDMLANEVHPAGRAPMPTRP